MDDWGSHFPALANCVINTIGPVLELGCGDYSTPLLHYLCKNRDLYSTDSNLDWIKKFKHLEGPRHDVIWVPDWSKFTAIDDIQWSVVLVDHAPGERRIEDIARLTDNCQYVVVHDTQAIQVYGYDKVFPLFKYSYTYKEFPTWTTILSNLVDPNEIFK